ncbi:MAG: hypothetical protein JXB48_24825 [Candidatus Latescibacteria bacterium]|nr:hypothetical protein [Candidatus Latescibacterota bacterium]
MSTFGYKYLFDSVKDKIRHIFSKKNDDVIRKIWDGTTHKERDFNLIAQYHTEKQKIASIRELVDAITWSDLDMDDVFLRIDHTVCPPGRQFLYHTIRTGDQKGNTDAFRTYRYFLLHKDIRESIQRILLKLNRPSAYFLVNLIFFQLPDKPAHSFLFPLSAAALSASIVLTFFYPYFFLAALTIAIINLLVHRYYTYRIIGFMPNLYDLNELLRVAVKLSDMAPQNDIPQIEILRKYEAAARTVNKKIGWLIVDTGSLDALSSSAMEYLNCFFLLNLITFFRSIKVIRQHQGQLQDIFDTVSSLDSAISVAGYLNSLPFHCEPVFNDDNIIDVKDVYHPLLAKPVANTFVLRNKSCLITGSNMAGKTTFMKTVGLNIILGRTLHICLAKSFNLPDVTVRTSIKRSDNINEDTSYYFREIESILKFLQLSAEPPRYLFLIDEIFRGTNTVERLSASTAVLDYLSSQNMVFVTTHDIELQHMLNNNFEMYHFSERIKNNEHYFDYAVQSGPCTSRNAIRLLALKGYPETITNRALEITRKLSCQWHKGTRFCAPTDLPG